MVKHLLILMVICIAAVPCQAEAVPFDTTGLKPCGTVTATRAIGGARFETPDGDVIKLALVKAPELWEKGAPYRSWPHAVEARDALAALIRDRELTLYCESDRLNRLGEIVAHVLDGDTWLQAQQVAGGHVFIFPSPTRRRGIDTLYRLEDIARQNRTGLWAYDNLQPITVDSRRLQPGMLRIVTGRVLKADKVGDTVYLNFGADWRTDFTIEVPAAAQRHFERRGLDPLSLGGKTVEVRGWVDWKAGPRILIQGPGQIRLLPEQAPAGISDAP
jgi:endonuclease YncB( thermonuclease family)